MNLARPHDVRRSTILRSLVGAVALAFSLTGCPSPNGIGIQDFGTVYGLVIDQNNKPVSGAFVTATGASGAAAVSTTPSGQFTISNVAVGQQMVSVNPPPGYSGPASGPATVIVVKGQATSVPTFVLQSTLPQT